jgi:hypothetical protein
MFVSHFCSLRGIHADDMKLFRSFHCPSGKVPLTDDLKNMTIAGVTSGSDSSKLQIMDIHTPNYNV